MPSSRRIAGLDEIPADDTLLVTAETDTDDLREVVLTRRSDGTVAAYENHCQHWTDVRIDKGDGARMRNGELVCTKHGAIFAVESGECLHGPCLGAALVPVPVSVTDRTVSFDQPGWSVHKRGPLEEDDRSRVDERGGMDL